MARPEAPLVASAWTRVRACRLYTRVWRGSRADASAVVLVHGIGVSGRYLIPTGNELASSFRVLGPDLPGWGRSEKPERALTLAELADVLVEWMSAVRLARATLLANSFGCQIAVDAAVGYPERVESLVLVGPTVDPYARSMPRQVARLALDSLREPLSLNLLIALDYLIFGPRRFYRTSRFALADRIEDKLPLVEAPTLVVRGGRDGIVSQRWAEEAARLLPRGRLAVVPRKGHAVNYNAPRELARLVRDFLDQESATRLEPPFPK